MKYAGVDGVNIFAERAYKKPAILFLVGLTMLVVGISSVAGLALAFARIYMLAIFNLPALPTALLFLQQVACLNARVISESMKGNMVMTVIEVSGLEVVMVAGAMFWASG